MPNDVPRPDDPDGDEPATAISRIMPDLGAMLAEAMGAMIDSAFDAIVEAQARRLNEILSDWLNLRAADVIHGALHVRRVTSHDQAWLTESKMEIALGPDRDIALFNQLVALWHKMWDEAGRYGPAGLKIRRRLIVFLALIIVTFVLDIAVAQAHLTDHQLLELAAVEGGTSIAVAVAKK
jgi:hypothetical protein